MLSRKANRRPPRASAQRNPVRSQPARAMEWTLGAIWRRRIQRRCGLPASVSRRRRASTSRRRWRLGARPVAGAVLIASWRRRRPVALDETTKSRIMPADAVSVPGMTLGAKGFAPSRGRRRSESCIERLQDVRRLFLGLSGPRPATAPVPAPRGSA
jgi:hypothetical protein